MDGKTDRSLGSQVGRTALERWQLRQNPSRWVVLAMALVGVATVAVAVFGGLTEGDFGGSLLVMAAIWFVLAGKMSLDRALRDAVARQAAEIAALREGAGPGSKTISGSAGGLPEARSRLERWVPGRWVWLIPASVAVAIFATALASRGLGEIAVWLGLLAAALAVLLWSAGLLGAVIRRQAGEIEELRARASGTRPG